MNTEDIEQTRYRRAQKQRLTQFKETGELRDRNFALEKAEKVAFVDVHSDRLTSGHQRKLKVKQLVSREEVARVANLAKLSLTGQEEERYSGELSAILDYFKIIDTAKVSDVQSAYLATSTTNAFRGEEIVVTDPEPILAGVPKRKDRFVKAPRVF